MRDWDLKDGPMQKYLHQAVVVLCAFGAMTFFATNSLAQEDEPFDASDVDQIEQEIQRNKQKEQQEQVNATAPVEEKTQDVKELSDLKSLAPFSEVSVLQRRFLPKSGRFQVFGGLSTITNDPWFSGIGGSFKFAYHFTESLGLELDTIFLSNSEKQAIKDLNSEHNVSTSSQITIKGYTGASLLWTPIYGKMGMFNRRIIPFDMYFAVGGGTSTIQNGSGGSTIHAGTGQIFAINKGMGFRWDFSWNMVNAKSNKSGDSNTYNNLLLTLGMSWFFPEAGYR